MATNAKVSLKLVRGFVDRLVSTFQDNVAEAIRKLDQKVDTTAGDVTNEITNITNSVTNIISGALENLTLQQVTDNGNVTDKDILMAGGRIEDSATGIGLLLTTKDSLDVAGIAGGINIAAGSAYQGTAGYVSIGAGTGIGGTGPLLGLLGGDANGGGSVVFTLGAPQAAGLDSGGIGFVFTAPQPGGSQGHVYLSGPGAFVGVQSLASLDNITLGHTGFWSRNDDTPMYRLSDGTDIELGSGGGGSLPIPDFQGQVLYAADETEFVKAVLLFNDEGMPIIDDDAHPVVG